MASVSPVIHARMWSHWDWKAQLVVVVCWSCGHPYCCVGACSWVCSPRRFGLWYCFTAADFCSVALVSSLSCPCVCLRLEVVFWLDWFGVFTIRSGGFSCRWKAATHTHTQLCLAQQKIRNKNTFLLSFDVEWCQRVTSLAVTPHVCWMAVDGNIERMLVWFWLAGEKSCWPLSVLQKCVRGTWRRSCT